MHERNENRDAPGGAGRFSLTELVIVIVIISILLGLVFRNLNVMGDAQA